MTNFKLYKSLKIKTMKKTILFIQKFVALAIVLGLSSCEDWDFIGMKGEGPIVSRNIETVEVEGIILDIPATVYLIQGDVQNISMEGQGNILNNINYYSNGGVLKLEFDQPVSKSEPVVIYMTVKSLKDVYINGSGSILTQSEFNTSGELNIGISGSGDIDLKANAKWVNMNISGSGTINLVSICQEISCDISGSGDINLNGGQAEKSNFNISGSGNVKAYSFITKYCLVNACGSGDTKVNVADFLSVEINGSGNVYYQGSPSLSLHVSGSGEVIRVY